VLRIGVADLLDRLALPDGLDPFDDEALVAVACDGSGGDRVQAVADRLRGMPVVVAAVAPPPGDPLAAALDLAVPDGATLASVEGAVEAHREAAVALAVLLRGGAERGVAEGLAAESVTYSMLQAGADHRRWLAGRPSRPARPASGGAAVSVRREGDVLHVVLERPEVHNAFSAALRDELIAALAVAAADPDLDVVLSGRGPSFCSGGDLAEFGTGPDPAAAHLIRLRRSAARALADVADRTTVRVHGAAIGAGTELAAFAGRVVASADARFALPELSMGLVPGAGGTVSVPRRIGRRRTALLVLTGMTLDAATAHDWGLVDDVVPTPNWV